MAEGTSRVARYEGGKVGSSVDIVKAQLDETSDVYYISSSGKVDMANPNLVLSRRSKEVDELIDAFQGGIPEAWGDIAQSDITLEIIPGESKERLVQTAVLAHAALVDTLMAPANPRNYWIRELESESVAIVDKEGNDSLYDSFEMNSAKIVQSMGAKGLGVSPGYKGDAWIVLGHYGNIMAKANVLENRYPFDIPEQQSLKQRLAAMTPAERKDYKHLDTKE